MTSDLQRVIAFYAERGWADANRIEADEPSSGSAYLILASDFQVLPRSEVQVTMRCHRPFRANRMIVTEDGGRFDLVDLKVNFRSQFAREQNIALRGSVVVADICGLREVRPDPIHWPLEVCVCGSEVSARALIPEGCEEDPGAFFEVVLLGDLLGEAVF